MLVSCKYFPRIVYINFMLGRCEDITGGFVARVTHCPGPRPNALANYQVSAKLDFFRLLKLKSLIAFHQKPHTLDWASRSTSFIRTSHHFGEKIHSRWWLIKYLQIGRSKFHVKQKSEQERERDRSGEEEGGGKGEEGVRCRRRVLSNKFKMNKNK